ncbi:hypothetical protein [Marinobacterium sp. BA1]|uniref:hypothetical protein n=1 Tax=Marinobacterium sp. BA1 TaxID=3138931 RepID=UPI0032E7C653
MIANTSDVQAIYNAVIALEKERQGPLAFVMHNHIRDKSALFKRLQAGFQPLIVPPPLAHSYPWYEVIESDAEHTVMVEGLDQTELTPGDICIHRARWVIVNKHSDTSWVVTHPNWQDLGFTWLLELKQLPANEAEGYIYPHHNPSQVRATTLSDLEAIAKYFVDGKQRSLRAAVSRKESAAPGNTMEVKSNIRTRFLHRVDDELLRDRREKGLSDLLTDHEAQTLYEHHLEQLKADVLLDDDGNIIFNEWRMRRISPTVISENTYLMINEMQGGDSSECGDET